MRFLFVYNGGDLPGNEAPENIDRLWQWLDNLKAQGIEVARIVTSGGKTVSQDATQPYDGKIFGASIIEAKSEIAALELTKNWPELQFGGAIDVLGELQT